MIRRTFVKKYENTNGNLQQKVGQICEKTY